MSPTCPSNEHPLAKYTPPKKALIFITSYIRRHVPAAHPGVQDLHLGAAHHRDLLGPGVGRPRRPRPLLRPTPRSVRTEGSSDLVRTKRYPLVTYPSRFWRATQTRMHA